MTHHPHLVAILKDDEGWRSKPYTDTTGHLSIGWGRNLTNRGISLAEGQMLLNNDLDLATTELLDACPWASSLDEVRFAVLVMMSFNLGMPKLSGFKNTLRAVREGRWQSAARGMLSSKWAQQVGARANELASMMETGEWPDEVRA